MQKIRVALTSEGTFGGRVRKIKVTVDSYDQSTACEFMLMRRDVTFTAYLFFDEVTVFTTRHKMLFFNIIIQGCMVIFNKCFKH